MPPKVCQKRPGFAFAMVLLVLWLCSAPAAALEVPAITGRVNDYAHMLNPATIHQLDAALADLEASDGTQIVVATIDSLDGDNLEDFSIRMAEQWGIGQKGNDNGAILLVVKKERKIRIEVGYGLEGRLTDLMAGRIIRDVITPQFKMGRFDQGVANGVVAMIQTVRGEFKAPGSKSSTRSSDHRSPNLLGFLALIFLVNMVGRLKRGLGIAAGGILAPIAGAMFFNSGWMIVLGLIPVGMLVGLIASLFGGPLSFGRTITRSQGGFWGGGMGGGGFSGGGFGGFSGGGGGFGGGGASGGW